MFIPPTNTSWKRSPVCWFLTAKMEHTTMRIAYRQNQINEIMEKPIPAAPSSVSKTEPFPTRQTYWA
jgi:hypothetical protein